MLALHNSDLREVLGSIPNVSILLLLLVDREF